MWGVRHPAGRPGHNTWISTISSIYDIYIQVSLTQGVLTGLSRIARSGPVVMDWQVAADSSEAHVVCNVNCRTER